MCDIAIGDLVCLKGDSSSLSHGLGLVLDKREDTAEMLREFLQELGTPEDSEVNKEITNLTENYLLNNSVFLVHWHGGTTKKNIFRNIWMFYSEIELLSKVKDNALGEI